MVSVVGVAIGFAVAGAIAAFLVPGRPSRIVLVLAGLIAGYSVSTSLVILQRLVLGHFFDVDLLPGIETPLDLFALAAVNAATFLVGFFGGQWAERYIAPWKAAQRRPPASAETPDDPAPPARKTAEPPPAPAAPGETPTAPPDPKS